MDVSRAYSLHVFRDGLEAVEKHDHPCHHFVEWQRQNGYDPFQLPEPFSGRRSRTGLAFLGLNPSVTHDEVIPCYGEVEFDEYDEYFRRRFDDANRDESGRLVVHLKSGGSKAPRLWNNLERFGSEYLSELAPEGFRLGEDAVLLQAIRYKSTEGWLGDSATERRRTLEHQRTFTESLVDEGTIRILVPMGNDALLQLTETLSFESDVGASAGGATGNTYIGRTSAGSVIRVCPVKHMSYPPSQEAKSALARQILAAVGEGNSASKIDPVRLADRSSPTVRASAGRNRIVKGAELIRPQDVLEALDWLVAKGLTDSHFYPVHHFWEKGERERIRSHRTYVEKLVRKGSRYQSNSPNIITGCRIIEWRRLVEKEGLSIERGKVRVRKIETLDDVQRITAGIRARLP